MSDHTAGVEYTVPEGTGPAKEQTMLTLELEERTAKSDRHGRDHAQTAEDALTEVLRLIGQGYTSGYLYDADGHLGYWELSL